MEIVEGRQTAAYDKDVVVFLIGMRVNKLRAWRQWLPVAKAMSPMLRELSNDPDSGLLGFRVFPGLRTTTMLQYWESAEKLQAFANDPDRTHRPAWTEFYKLAYKGGNVGIWHETYVVPAGQLRDRLRQHAAARPRNRRRCRPREQPRPHRRRPPREEVARSGPVQVRRLQCTRAVHPGSRQAVTAWGFPAVVRGPADVAVRRRRLPGRAGGVRAVLAGTRTRRRRDRRVVRGGPAALLDPRPVHRRAARSLVAPADPLRREPHPGRPGPGGRRDRCPRQRRRAVLPRCSAHPRRQPLPALRSVRRPPARRRAGRTRDGERGHAHLGHRVLPDRRRLRSRRQAHLRLRPDSSRYDGRHLPRRRLARAEARPEPARPRPHRRRTRSRRSDPRHRRRPDRRRPAPQGAPPGSPRTRRDRLAADSSSAWSPSR